MFVSDLLEFYGNTAIIDIAETIGKYILVCHSIYMPQWTAHAKLCVQITSTGDAFIYWQPSHGLYLVLAAHGGPLCLHLSPLWILHMGVFGSRGLFPFSVCLWLYLRVRKQDEGRLSRVVNGLPALTLNLDSPGYFGFYERPYGRSKFSLWPFELSIC